VTPIQTENWMMRAVELSKRGFPAPNPRVGAVIVKDGQIIGEGFHEAAGCDHAEIAALRQAGGNARGADLFVTLEPCSHHGRTPPCTQAIIEAGIARVFIATTDPNPAAAGGAYALQEAGLETHIGICADEAASVNYRFLQMFRMNRPWVAVKAACSLDGRIAARNGESRWISDERARRRAHELRAEAGCVLVGAGTVAHDDPSLTVRHVQAKNQPLRVILDPDGSLPLSSKVFSDDSAQTLWVSRVPLSVPSNSRVSLFRCPTAQDGSFVLSELLCELERMAQISVLIEGGGNTIERFFRAGLVDEVELHVAPIVLGAGRSWAEGEGVERLADAWKLTDVRCEPLGNGVRINARTLR
jgi:diaminohydroxyphosphoribosylaminopyrimidine deaminase/5-amino-6-(5-phosphoribosylamino)uracil reductase